MDKLQKSESSRLEFSCEWRLSNDSIWKTLAEISYSNWYYWMMCRDSVAGIVNCYVRDGPGIESRWGRDFPHLYIPALGPTPPPAQWVPGLSTRDKAADARRWSPSLPIWCRGRAIPLLPPSLGPLWPFLGWTLLFNLLLLNELF